VLESGAVWAALLGAAHLGVLAGTGSFGAPCYSVPRRCERGQHGVHARIEEKRNIEALLCVNREVVFLRVINVVGHGVCVCVCDPLPRSLLVFYSLLL
jgi:hypothetical protein